MDSANGSTRVLVVDDDPLVHVLVDATLSATCHMLSATTINRAGTAARGVGRAMREGADVDAAKESVESVLAEKAKFEADCAAELAALSASLSEPEITALDLKPARGGITVNFFGLGWI